MKLRGKLLALFAVVRKIFPSIIFASFFACGLPAALANQDIQVTSLSSLPPEAREVITQIRRGGPFNYGKDGSVFGNYERILPAKQRGFYHEYTVPTPGVSHRGARRIVTGGTPPIIYYYTADHYRSFAQIRD